MSINPVKAIGVIPARLGSTRLSEKILRSVAGKPMIQHVWERAKQAKKFEDVIIATDDARIEACVRGFGGKACMTRKDHPNGTSRIAEVTERFKQDIVINIQGDQPLVDPKALDEMVSIFEKEKNVEMLTLAVRMTDKASYENPNVVKVVCDAEGNALYFSRAAIPFFQGKQDCAFSFLKHLGVYGYRRDFLKEFIGWGPGVLENTEKLEQLRVLERGRSIRVIETAYDFISVDTEEDLQEVEKRLQVRSTP
ncbi:MAG TPA: 3-deoxy-manno-octulosonate cytidylyltransferase [Candidatus Omnitrophota bacterium]|nr:3-deoxy-manno-octulosonate cytidylyltransferase [Candidatus Omnitrophota bacterium]HRY85231.1 3-deoxy-manno-octulosonate cytidylyltransferase [Candidatus Omnitrophota bacterium]